MNEGGRARVVIKDSNLLESILNALGDDDEVSRCWQFKKMRIRFYDIEIQEESLVKHDFSWHAFSRTEYSQFRQTLARTEQQQAEWIPTCQKHLQMEKKLFLRDDALFSLRQNEMFAQIESLITLSFQAALNLTSKTGRRSFSDFCGAEVEPKLLPLSRKKTNSDRNLWAAKANLHT